MFLALHFIFTACGRFFRFFNMFAAILFTAPRLCFWSKFKIPLLFNLVTIDLIVFFAVSFSVRLSVIGSKISATLQASNSSSLLLTFCKTKRFRRLILSSSWSSVERIFLILCFIKSMKLIDGPKALTNSVSCSKGFRKAASCLSISMSSSAIHWSYFPVCFIALFAAIFNWRKNSTVWICAIMVPGFSVLSRVYI